MGTTIERKPLVVCVCVFLSGLIKKIEGLGLLVVRKNECY